MKTKSLAPTQDAPDKQALPSVEGEKEGGAGEEEAGEKRAPAPKMETESDRQKLQQDQEEMAALGDLSDDIKEVLKVSKGRQIRVHCT